MIPLIVKVPEAVISELWVCSTLLEWSCNQLQNKFNSKTDSESIMIQRDQCKHLLKSVGAFQLHNF